MGRGCGWGWAQCPPLLPRASWGRMAAHPSLTAVLLARRWERQGRAWLPTSPSGFLLWLDSKEPGLSQPNPEASRTPCRPSQAPPTGPAGGGAERWLGAPGTVLTPDTVPGRRRRGADGGPGRHWPRQTRPHEPPTDGAGSEVMVHAGLARCQALPDVEPPHSCSVGPARGLGLEVPLGLQAGLPPRPLEAPAPKD